MDVNTGADGGISGNINFVSRNIITDGVTGDTGIVMPTVPIGMKAKKAAVSCSHCIMNTFIKSNICVEGSRSTCQEGRTGLHAASAATKPSKLTISTKPN